MWPSSDMRMMHRREGGKLRIFNSLGIIKSSQVLWDALAITTVGVIGGMWTGIGYGLGYWAWHDTKNSSALIPLIVMAGVFWPLGMAGFSYSSKLAVLRRSGFGEKRRLFFLLFLNPRVMLMSWLMFFCRIGISVVFVFIVSIRVLGIPWTSYHPLSPLADL